MLAMTCPKCGCDIDYTIDYSLFGDDTLATAYASVEEELLALTRDHLEVINIDLMPAINTAAGVIPEVETYRSQIVEQLPKFNLARFDKMKRYAMAAAYAHTVHLAATEPQDRLNPLFQEAVEERHHRFGPGNRRVLGEGQRGEGAGIRAIA